MKPDNFGRFKELLADIESTEEGRQHLKEAREWVKDRFYFGLDQKVYYEFSDDLKFLYQYDWPKTEEMVRNLLKQYTPENHELIRQTIKMYIFAERIKEFEKLFNRWKENPTTRNQFRLIELFDYWLKNEQ